MLLCTFGWISLKHLCSISRISSEAASRNMKSIKLSIVAIIFFSRTCINVLNWFAALPSAKYSKYFIYQNIRESSVAMLPLWHFSLFMTKTVYPRLLFGFTHNLKRWRSLKHAACITLTSWQNDTNKSEQCPQNLFWKKYLFLFANKNSHWTYLPS